MNLKKQLIRKAFLSLACLFMSLSVLKAIDYYCDPVSGNINNSGSSTSPWKTLAEVFNANKTFSPGDIIYLRNGHHGIVTIKGNNAGFVTIKAQPGHTPTATRLFANNAHRWIVDGLTVSPEVIGQYLPKIEGEPYESIVKFESNSSYITVQNCHVYAAANPQSWSEAVLEDRLPIGIQSDAAYTTLTNNLIEAHSYHIMVNFDAHHSIISYNTLRRQLVDGIRILSNDSKVEYNYIHTVYSLDEQHDDGIQSWSGDGTAGNPVGGSTVYRVEIRGNTIINVLSASQPHRNDGYGMQGIGLFDGYFNSWIVENNLIVTDMLHGIAFFGGQNSRVVNNTVLKNPLNNKPEQPWITFRKHKNGDPGYGNLIRNNIYTINDQWNTAPTDHNIVTTNLSPLFINYFGFDFRLSSSSAAINAGTTSLAPTIDQNQIARSGNPDLGCFEYGTPVPTPGQGGGVIDEDPPSNPGTPVVTGNSIASVSLTWTASTDDIGVAGYNIYVDGALGTTSTTNSATVTGLNPGTQYTFTVTAFDAVGNVSGLSSGTPGSTQSGSIVSATAATASSYEAPDNVPANAIDGTLSTRWASDGDGQWLQLQLSGTANVTDIGLAFYKGNERSYSFELEASTDGSNWTTIFDGSSSGSTTGIELFDVTDANASYIRYLGHGNSSNTWNNVNEIKFYSAGPPDTQAPTVPTGLATGTVTTNSVALSWNASTDTGSGVTGYKVYIDGANPQTVAGTSTTINGLTDGTQYSFTVSAFDAVGNESAQSGSVQATTVEITGVTSSSTWQSFNESTQTGEFTATFTAVPNGNNIDALTGIQNGSASAYGDMACIIRFNTGGTIDARDGGAYTATNTVNYSQGITYSFRVEVDVTSHTYDVFVTPQGGLEQTVALDFTFRTEQVSVSQLTGWTVYAYQGSHTVDNMSFSTGADNQPPTVPGQPIASNITTTSVDLSWSTSTDAQSGVANYKVYTGGVYTKTVTGTSTTMNGLTAATQYSFTVSAVDGVGNESAQSTARLVTTNSLPDTQAPSVPGGLASGATTSSTIALSWNASTDAGGSGLAGYKVYTNGANPITVAGTSTTITGLTADTQYSFTVSAYDNASNESAQSSAIQASTDEEPVGGNNIISNGEFDNGTTDWVAGNYGGTAALSAVTGQGMSGTNAMQITISAAGTNPWDIQIYQDISITNGETYQISFQAKAASNRTITAVIQNTESPYEEYWTQAINLTTSTQTFGPYTFNSSVTDATTRFKFFVAGNASTIYVDNVVVSDESAPVDTQAPSVPGGLASGATTTSTIALSWNASTDAGGSGLAGYKVYTNGANPVTVAGTSTTITGLTAGTQYSFTVSAYDNASNESAQSSSIQASTQSGGSTMDVTVQAEDYSSQSGCSVGTANAGWTGTGYLDYGGNGTYGEWTVTAPGAGTVTLTVTYANGVAVNRQCGVTVNGVSQGNLAFAPTGAWTTWTTVTLSIPVNSGSNTIRITANTSEGGPNVDKLDLDGTGLSSAIFEFADNAITPSMKIYPNPLNESVLNIEINGYNHEVVNVAILDMTGRTVFNKTESVIGSAKLTIPAERLNKGIYIISVNGEGINSQQKLIVE